MSDWNIAAKPQDDRDKVNVDLAVTNGAKLIHPSG